MKSFFISALRASAVLGTAFSAKTAEEQEFCNLLDPIIRKDCGIAAAGKDDIVTKAECEALNCCWDTAWYAGAPKSPWCFYPVYYKAPGDTNTDDNDVLSDDINDQISIVAPKPTTTKATTTTTTEKMVTVTEKIVIEKVPIQKKPLVERPVIKPIDFSKPSSSLLNRPISSVSKKNPSTDHGDLVTSYRKKTCQQLSESKVLNETMKDLTMERMKCNTVDFLNFDHKEDPNLNQDTSNGMEILMKK